MGLNAVKARQGLDTGVIANEVKNAKKDEAAASSKCADLGWFKMEGDMSAWALEREAKKLTTQMYEEEISRPVADDEMPNDCELDIE